MKATKLQKNVLEYIVSDLQMTINRLGINATLSTKIAKDYRGEEFVKIVSTPFQTMPVLFKEITIDGTIGTGEEDEKNVEVGIRLNYAYTHFRGGGNGHELGIVRYVVEKNIPEKCMDLRYFIHKTDSIEI